MFSEPPYVFSAALILIVRVAAGTTFYEISLFCAGNNLIHIIHLRKFLIFCLLSLKFLSLLKARCDNVLEHIKSSGKYVADFMETQQQFEKIIKDKKEISVRDL